MRRAVLGVLILISCGSDVGDMEASGSSGAPGDETTGADTVTTSGATTGLSFGGSQGNEAGASSSGDPAPPELPDLPFLPPECPAAAVQDDVLDPNEVYLWGSLGESGSRMALSHWSTPNHAVVGWESSASNYEPTIRPMDGRMLYIDLAGGVVREFHCDTCPWESGSAYPLTPYENDPKMDGCPGGGQGFLEFLVAPDGDYLTRCNRGWHDGTDEPRYVSGAGDLLHLGEDDWALAEAGLVSLLDGALVVPVFPQFTQTHAIRTDPEGGFFVVSGEHTAPELLHVDFDGVVQSLGAFPPIPRDYVATDIAALDGCLALFQIGRGPGAGEDVILRRAIDDETRIVYSELDDPLVQIHISTLVTGV